MKEKYKDNETDIVWKEKERNDLIKATLKIFRKQMTVLCCDIH